MLADAFVRDAMAKAAAISPGRVVIAGSAPDGAERSAYFKRLARQFHADLVDQGGGSLGARMARMLAPFAPAACGGALLIGTDTPTLPRALLKKSLDRLGRARVVIAPSFDGGYYAIGVRGAIPPIFSGIRWGGGRVFELTVTRLKRARLSYATGPLWYDVDRASDLLVLAQHLRLLERTGREIPCPLTAAVMKRLGPLDATR